MLNRDQFDTVVAYAESVFNNRPISYVSRADSEVIPLTPNHLLYGRSLRVNSPDIGDIDLNDPTYEFGSKGKLNSMCKKLKSTLAQVKKNWAADYLAYLRERDQCRNKYSPATKYILVAKPGDVVLIVEADNSLRLGRILKLIESSDGEIRSAEVKSKSSVGIYPLVNLRHLESCEINKVAKDVDVIPDVGSHRPKREAARQAQVKWLQMTLIT